MYPLLLLLVLLIPLCGTICAITPLLMPKSECFTVTVPENAQKDERIVTLKKRFIVIVATITALCTIIAARAAANVNTSQNELFFILVYTLCVLIPVTGGFCLMLRYRHAIQTIKKEEGWAAEGQVSVAVIDQNKRPKQLSLAWNLLYLPVSIITLAFIVTLYPTMPAEIPMKADLAGNITQTVAKSTGTVLFPLYVQAFLAVCLIFSHWATMRSQIPTNPKAPATSAYAYGVFTKTLCIMLLAMGLALNLTIGITFPLSCAGLITMTQAALWVSMVALLMVVAAVVFSVKVGQSGSKVFARMNGTDSIARDDDRYWKLGVFYVNRNDASVFVPKRFGVGITVNLARPATWIFLGALIALIAGLCVLVGTFS